MSDAWGGGGVDVQLGGNGVPKEKPLKRYLLKFLEEVGFEHLSQ